MSHARLALVAIALLLAGCSQKTADNPTPEASARVEHEIKRMKAEENFSPSATRTEYTPPYETKEWKGVAQNARETAQGEAPGGLSDEAYNIIQQAAQEHREQDQEARIRALEDERGH